MITREKVAALMIPPSPSEEELAQNHGLPRKRKPGNPRSSFAQEPTEEKALEQTTGKLPIRLLFEFWCEMRRMGVSVDPYSLLHQARQIGQCTTATELIDFLQICRFADTEQVPEEQRKPFVQDVDRALEKLLGPVSGSNRVAPPPAPPSFVAPLEIPNPRLEREHKEASPETEGYTAILYCGACGALNPANRNFCTSCGAALWCLCPNCGKKTPVREAYCGNCGHPIGREIQEATRECEEKLQKANELLVKNRPGEALGYLEEVLNGKYAWLQTDARRRAAQLKQQAEEQLQHQNKESELLFQKAREIALRGDFDAALKILEAIPEGSWNDRREQARKEFLELKAELQESEKKLQQLLRGGKLLELLEVTARILELYPNHSTARATAHKLLPKLHQALQTLEQKHQYTAALKLIERFPRVAWDAQLEAKQKQLREVLGLKKLILEAAYSYPYLGGMYQRLQALLPSDSPLLASAAKVLQTVETKKSGGTSWSTPLRHSSHSLLGPPIRWVDRFRRIQLGEACDPKYLHDFPGVFLGAAGAALQGLGLTRGSLNCVVNEGSHFKRLLGSVTSLLSARQTTTWGIDFGWSSAKAVRLEYNTQTKHVTLTHLDLEPYDKPLHHATTEGQTVPILVEALQRLWGRHSVKTQRVVIALPSNMVLFQPRQVPPADRDKLENLLQYEVRRIFPRQGENWIWSFDLWNPPSQDSTELQPMASGHVLALVCGMARPLWIGFSRRLQAIGLEVDIVIPDTMALYQWYEADYLASEEEASDVSAASEKASPPPTGGDSSTPVMLMDIGATQSKAMYISESHLRLYHIGLAADTLLRILCQQLKLSFSEAEKAIREWTYLASPEKLFCLEQFWEQSPPDLQRVLDHIQAEGLPAPKTILVCGGGACIPGLLDYWNQ